ncbi:50S ribosomal protein L32 [candidate division WWE3 bacterium]|nr:50S ribosomal protein L32 [candidate division WWE3 bacterium]MBT7349221.1 50S ribosomal protein L32 [candidate division WWE3 bacterium]
MPVPKGKHSKKRTRRKRNSHYFREVVGSIKCKACGEFKLPHRVCQDCGE